MRTVAVYIKSKEARAFAERFFAGRKEYSPQFFTNVRELMRRLSASPPDYFVTESPTCLGRIDFSRLLCPTIALVDAGNRSEGIHAIMKRKVENYLLAPYYEDDFECQLKLVAERRDFVERMYQDRKDLEAVAELTYMLTSTLDPQKVLYLIVKKLSELLPVSRCSILSIDFRDATRARVVSSFENPSIGPMELDLERYPEIRKSLRTKKAVVVRDAMSDPLMTPVRSVIGPLGIRSIVVMPVIFRSEVIGTLFLRTSSTSHRFTDREIRLCRNIAHSAANALYNAFLFEEIQNERAELQELSITDFLTGVYNVRYLYHRLENELSRSIRYKQSIGCLMIDIDLFKRINDTYGHRTGDMVLREFAGLLKSHTRRSDVFARYGGEEFIMILPHTSLVGTATKARRLLATVRNHRFKGIAGDEVITISIGVSAYPDMDVASRDDLIAFADTALLRAKKDGRDRTVAYDPSLSPPSS